MTKKMKLFIYLSVFCAVILSTIYYVTNKNKQAHDVPETVNVQNTVNSKKLTSDSKVSLFSKGKIQKEYTLDEIKEKFNIKDDLSESKLIELLEKKGYIFDSTINNEFMFKKKEHEIKPGKYYIGEKDGFLAIYKSDNNGTLSIEKDSDVYRDFKSVSSLCELDREKIENFDLMYSSREEAEENLSEFLS